MSRTSNDPANTEIALDPSASSSAQSRDSVVASIVRLNEDEASSVVGDRKHQLRGLIQTLRNRQGRFALIFVVCNEVPLQRTLTREVKENLSDQDLFELRFTGEENSLLDKLLQVPGAPHPLFVYGLDNLFPSSAEGRDAEKLRREETLQELQLRREQFHLLNRPLVLWMPEYVYTLIGQQAVDFWSWQSGTFFFTEMQSRKVGLEQTGEASGELEEKFQRAILRGAIRATRSRLRQLPAPPRDFADTRLSAAKREQAGLWHAAYYLQLLSTADDLYQKGGEAVARGLSLFDNERSNVEAGQEWAAARFADDEQAAHLCNEYPNAGTYVLNLRQHPRDSIRWHEAALSAAQQLKDRAAEGGHLGSLGLAYANLGETRRATEFYEQRLTIAREIGDRHGEGSALGNLGLAYAELGAPRHALEFYEQQLAITREIGDRHGEGSALGNMGNAYAALGETRRAIEFHEQALVIAREIGDRRGEGNALGNLGNAYVSLGETERAIESMEAALKIFEEIESPSANVARWNLEILRGESR